MHFWCGRSQLSNVYWEQIPRRDSYHNMSCRVHYNHSPNVCLNVGLVYSILVFLYSKPTNICTFAYLLCRSIRTCG